MNKTQFDCKYKDVQGIVQAYFDERMPKSLLMRILLQVWLVEPKSNRIIEHLLAKELPDFLDTWHALSRAKTQQEFKDVCRKIENERG